MAIVTGNVYKGFTFGDISSKAYGVYITQEAAYNAPERDVSVYEIAGRNGAYILDNGRFSNITVTYKCGIALDSETDFESAIRVFRNALASKAGKYVRLTDEYNPNEFRQAAFLGGIEVEMADRRAGEFTVSFDCKPQRFLKSGEIPRTIGGAVTNTQTKSGTVVSIDSDGGDKATSLIATIEAVQTGSGDPSPTNVRPITGQTSSNVYVGGKNILRINRVTTTVSGVTFTINSDGSINVEGTTTADNVFINLNYGGATKMAIPAGTWKAKVGAGASGNVRMQLISNDVWRGNGGTSDFKSITIPEGSYNSWCRLQIQNSGTTVSETLYPIICADTETSGAFKGYDGKLITAAFGRTVYGGTVDVVTGTLTVTHKAVDLGTLGWTYINEYFYSTTILEGGLVVAGGQTTTKCTAYKPYIGSMAAFLSGDGIVWTGASNVAASPRVAVRDTRYTNATEFKTAVSGVKLVYVLATPQTYQLTPQEVRTLLGDNNVWADTGDISITYGHDPNVLVNPTLFETRPLLQADGYGQISINGDSLSIYNLPLGEITLPYAVRINDPALGLTYTYDISNTNFLNVGDEILFTSRKLYGGIDAYFSGVTEIISGTNFTENITSAGGTVSKGTYWATNESTIGKDPTEFPAGYDFTLNVRFSYGTASTQTFTVSFTINGKTSSNATKSANISESYQVTYDGNNTIAVNFLAPVVSESVTVNKYGFPLYGKSEVIKANSTYSLNTTTYIDLDIGEAYAIEDGQATSLNNVVEIPAELPTLKSGVNTITYDNTITEFSVVPRWWEV